MELPREVGTVAKDRPHEFRGLGVSCSTCNGPLSDGRHAEWARTEVASRQTAAAVESLPRVEG